MDTAEDVPAEGWIPLVLLGRLMGDGSQAQSRCHVQVLDSAGVVLYEELVDLPGTRDPDAVVTPNVVGRSVRLFFELPEDCTATGFSELIVMVARP